MTHRVLPAALLLLALAAGACGGAASPSPAATSTAPASAQPAASSPTQPSEAPASNPPTSGPEATPTGGPEIDLGAAAAALEGIDSYRLAMTVEGQANVTVEATVIRQPEPAQAFSISTAGATQKIIVIGDQAWLDAGAGTYAPVPVAAVAGLTAAFDPVALLGTFNQPALLQAMTAVGDEERNGQATMHYRLDPGSVAGQAASLPPEAQMDLWLADAGYMVAIEAHSLDATTSLVKMDVTNVNDPANEVTAPG